MTGKISKSALSGIAQQALDAVGDGQVPETNIGSTMMTRQDAISRMRDTNITRTEFVDPALCRPSEQNARNYSRLTAENCADLIDSIRSEGAQHTAALVRPTGDAITPYEIVTGSRRHFAVSWLRANNYPDIKYLIEIRDLTDEASFRLSDEENRARKDVTDHERGTKYAQALESFYGGSISTMAARLAINERTLRRYLAVAAIPPSIFDAYGGPEFFNVSHARELEPVLSKSAKNHHAILGEAVLLGAEQKQREVEGKARLVASIVTRRLIDATKDKRGSGSRAEVRRSADGNELFTFTAPTKVHGLNVRLPKKLPSSADELKRAMLDLIDQYYS